jgi:hypothetical protein
MTLSIAWIRKAGQSRELIVASDSRLTSAGYVDVCQKVFTQLGAARSTSLRWSAKSERCAMIVALILTDVTISP